MFFSKEDRNTLKALSVDFNRLVEHLNQNSNIKFVPAIVKEEGKISVGGSLDLSDAAEIEENNARLQISARLEKEKDIPFFEEELLSQEELDAM